MSMIAGTGLALAGLGLLLGWIGARRLFARRLASALRFEGVAIALVASAALLLLISSNLTVYNRLSYEAPVATIRFMEVEPMNFQAVLHAPGDYARTFELHGDEWQLDARILKWHGLANLIGLDAQYRLHRLAGRYTSIDQERVSSRSIHTVGDEPRIDIWQLASNYGIWFDWLLDAAYGSAVYLPMTDGAEYEISVSQSGLVARPANTQAKHAVSRWIGL